MHISSRKVDCGHANYCQKSLLNLIRKTNVKEFITIFGKIEYHMYLAGLAIKKRKGQPKNLF